MVGTPGIEPGSLTAADFKSAVFTNFTMPPLMRTIQHLRNNKISPDFKFNDRLDPRAPSEQA